MPAKDQGRLVDLVRYFKGLFTLSKCGTRTRSKIFEDPSQEVPKWSVLAQSTEVCQRCENGPYGRNGTTSGNG